MISSGQPGMRRISSRLTFFTKRVLPAAWFSFLAYVVVAMLTSDSSAGSRAFVLLILAAIAAFGYIVMKKLVLDVVDEVWDAGHELMIRDKGVEDHIPLSAIMNISYVTVTNPPRVTLSLRQPALLGKEITFLAPSRLIPFARSPIVDDLIRRVDVARSR